jgi:glycosyltransferase involved in cell wall biosynthesis
MIPTYNCAKYLRETLRSVLSQDAGSREVQIEVVDDCSTRDDPESVVREMGGDRVAFYRQPQNLGVTGNFNTCVRRSRGQLVHILHGDDLIEPRFYAEIGASAEQHPSASIYMTRAHHIDQHGNVFDASPFIDEYKSVSVNPCPLLYGNPLRTAAIVVRRSLYEAQGGFCEYLVHVADWEMWIRATAIGGALMIDSLLARYREFLGNDTSRLRRNADNLRDCLRLREILRMRHRDFDLDRFHGVIRQLASLQVSRFRSQGDKEAAAKNVAFLKAIPASRRGWVRSVRDRLASLPIAGLFLARQESRRKADYQDRAKGG